VAPDKFKGTLTAAEAADIIATAIRETFPRANVTEFPQADGGEGTCEALTRARSGEFHRVKVRGPLGDDVEATFGMAGRTAFMEMASASGLQLVPEARRNPLVTSTYGFGQLIRAAIDAGATTIIAGIGGSATNDGGTGMAEALGAKFFAEDGSEMHGLNGGSLQLVRRIDCSTLTKALSGVTLRIASDVTNPLLGKNGCAAIYAPQKGATPEQIQCLEDGMRNLYKIADPDNAAEFGLPGDGAAGGLGFGFRVFCHAEFESGARLVMRETGLLHALEAGEVDVVITGEGRTDSQTEAGKLCAELARAAGVRGVPCLLLSGGIGCPRESLLGIFDGVFVSGIGRENIQDIMAHAREDLHAAAVSIASALAVGNRG
jgi:glycerate kinase